MNSGAQILLERSEKTRSCSGRRLPEVVVPEVVGSSASGVVRMLLVMAPLVVLLWRHIPLVGDANPPEGDYSVVLLDVLSASRGQLLLGPYSRYHFHHPGPLLTYLLAAGASVIPGFGVAPYHHFHAVVLSQLLISLGALAVGYHALIRCCRSFLTVALSVGCFLWSIVAVRPSVISDIWGPSAVLCPLWAWLCSALALTTGNGSLAVWLGGVVCGSLSLQTHLCTAPAVLCSAFMALVGAFVWGNDQKRVQTGIVVGAVLLLMWFPPLYEQITEGREGNVVRILKAIHRGEGGPPAVRLLRIEEHLLPWCSSRVALVGVILLALSAIWFRTTRRIGLFLMALLAAVLWGGLSVQGKPHDYLFWHVIPVGALLCTGAMMTVGEMGRRLIPWMDGRRGRSIAAGLGGCLLLWIAWILPVAVKSGELIEHPVDELFHSLSRKGPHIRISTALPDEWDWAARLAYRVELDGRTACIERFRLMFYPLWYCPPSAGGGESVFVIPPKEVAGVDVDIQ